MVPAQVQVLSERQWQGLLSEHTANLALLGCLLHGSCPRPGSSSEAWSLDRALSPHCHRIFPNHSSLRPFSRLKHRRVSTGLGRRFSSSALLLCSTGNTLKKRVVRGVCFQREAFMTGQEQRDVTIMVSGVGPQIYTPLLKRVKTARQRSCLCSVNDVACAVAWHRKGEGDLRFE